MKFLIALLVAVAPIVANAADKRSEGLQALQDPERLVSIGNHARASGDPMLALSFYDRALQVDPGNLPALRAATETALSQNWPQSLGLAERWVSREPRNALAHLAVGSGLLIQNRPTEAMQALSMSEAAGGPKSAIALQRGMALDLLGQPRDAQISYAAALQNAPDDLTVLQQMALSFAIGGDDVAALQLLQPHSEKGAGNPSFERAIVLIHALAGRTELAQRIAGAALSPQQAATLGGVLARIGSLRSFSEKAAAVHLGILPDLSRPEKNVPQVAVPALPPAPKETVSLPPAPQPVARPPVETPSPVVTPLPEATPRLSAEALRSSKIWVQVASTPEAHLLKEEFARLRSKSGGVLKHYNAYVQRAGEANRLLVGPFSNWGDAQTVVKRLKGKRIDGLVNRTPNGADIAPL